MYIKETLAPCPGFGWEGGAEFKTQIVELMNGREKRNAEWSQARHRYSAPFNNISKEAYREIKQMHVVCRGQLHAFLFHDVLDDRAEMEVFGIGDGVRTQFQLTKTSTVAGVSYTRAVYAPDYSTFEVRVAGAVTTAYTLDEARGVITFDAPPADSALLRWSGNFFVWVRFAEDYLPFTLDNPNATNGIVNLIEVPPPAANETV